MKISNKQTNQLEHESMIQTKAKYSKTDTDIYIFFFYEDKCIHYQQLFFPCATNNNRPCFIKKLTAKYEKIDKIFIILDKSLSFVIFLYLK